MNRELTAQDQLLIQLLRQNARASVTDLAKDMNLSRTTVQQRLNRLEEQGVITGYTVRLSPRAEANAIQAHVMVKSDNQNSRQLTDDLSKIPQVETILSVSGRHDYIVIIRVADTQQLDDVLDLIWEVDGVTNTESSVVLSTRLDRR
jgi:DNA-binding Lrp family transcriptional regulator